MRTSSTARSDEGGDGGALAAVSASVEVASALGLDDESEKANSQNESYSSAPLTCTVSPGCVACAGWCASVASQ